MARTKGHHDVASTVRGAFIRAVKSLESPSTGPDGEKWEALPLSTIMEKLLRDRPEVALNAVAKFVPQKMLIETTIVDQLDERRRRAQECEPRLTPDRTAERLRGLKHYHLLTLCSEGCGHQGAGESCTNDHDIIGTMF